MTTTINAQATNGLLTTADGSGILKVQSNGTTTNSIGWLNMNGASGASSRGSYNISSVTRASQGVYSLTFTNAQTSSAYCVVTSTSGDQAASSAGSPYNSPLFSTSPSVGNLGALPSTTGFGWGSGNWNSAGFTDPTYICIAIFGN